MATDLGGGDDALLALAREFRRAISSHQATIRRAVDAYDHAAGDRVHPAAGFLQAVQRADSTYESSSRLALEGFRNRIEGGDWR
jgi:hypothetical protein